MILGRLDVGHMKANEDILWQWAAVFMPLPHDWINFYAAESQLKWSREESGLIEFPGSICSLKNGGGIKCNGIKRALSIRISLKRFTGLWEDGWILARLASYLGYMASEPLYWRHLEASNNWNLTIRLLDATSRSQTHTHTQSYWLDDYDEIAKTGIKNKCVTFHETTCVCRCLLLISDTGEINKTRLMCHGLS